MGAVSLHQAVKLHTLLDLRGIDPTFIHISDGKMHDVNVLDLLLIEAGAFYIMDQGYLDFERLYALDQVGGFFVTRAKQNLDARRLYSAPVDRDTGLICDQTIALNGFYAAKHYPGQLRRIPLSRSGTGKNLVFLTNQFALATTICALYGADGRWNCSQVDQAAPAHQALLRDLRERCADANCGSPSASMSWWRSSKQLRLDVSLHALLQILSLTLFEKLPLKQAVASIEPFPNNQVLVD